MHHRGGAEQQKARGAERGAARADCRVTGSSRGHEGSRSLVAMADGPIGTVSIIRSYDGRLHRSARLVPGGPEERALRATVEMFSRPVQRSVRSV